MSGKRRVENGNAVDVLIMFIEDTKCKKEILCGWAAQQDLFFYRR